LTFNLELGQLNSINAVSQLAFTEMRSPYDLTSRRRGGVAIEQRIIGQVLDQVDNRGAQRCSWKLIFCDLGSKQSQNSQTPNLFKPIHHFYNQP
jgi:hypothetical protein